MICTELSDSLQQLANETNNKTLAKTCEEILEKSSLVIEDIIQSLSQHLLCLENAKLFQKYFSKILLALLSARIPHTPVFSNENYETCSDTEKCDHMEYSIVLAYLSDHPDVLQYALKYFEINSIPPYEVFIHHKESYSVAPKKRRLLKERQNEINEYHIVSCSYNLLKKLPNEFSAKWDWTKFVSYFCTNENAEVRWMVKECIVILTNMTEVQSKTLLKNLNLTDLDELKCISSTNSCSRPQICDQVDEKFELKSDSVINIDGIMIPVYDKDNVKEGNLVPVKSTVNNLRSVALAVASGKALSLMGPVGSGKTSLVEHLATITGRKGVAFKKVQLGDQTDSRMLLGSHQCTDVPGEFVWRPGVLTEAVQNGHWLLLEDIDCAALDVASTLSSLLERNSLCVPGYRDSLPVTPGFQLFVTQRTVVTNYGFQKKMSNSSALLQKHLTQINVEPLSRSELSEIIQILYPKLSTICPRMLEVFMMFSVGSHDSSLQSKENIEKEANVTVIRGSRLISTRDLMKFCARAVVDFDVSSPESAMKVLQDALDIFTSSVSSPSDRLELAKKVGTCLGIVETKSQFYCQHYKPNISLNPNYLEAGRAKVKRKEKTLESLDFDNRQVVFSFTRQSACLLEKISCCVSSNEPVLLVGETGTGKTSSVQYLARQTGHKLVVINMNQQSDSADLLGGYKPVDLKYVIRPIKAEFEILFRSFYNVEKNKKFLIHIETCYETESWTALLTLMKQSHKSALNRLIAEKKEDRLKVWQAFGYKLMKLEQQVKAASRLTFAFIEGSLVKAMQEGHWVLLDEINLASAEILECLAGLLEDKDETIELLEKGDKVPIKRHPDFTLFACMNPATDVGKKDLPVGLRNRFTEFFIDELTERNDLMLLIGDYLYHMNIDGATLEAIFKFYTNVKKEAKLNLVDGAGNAPHYSLRTLCRALTAAAKARCGTVSRSLYEAFCLSFLTQLDSSSHPKVEAMIAKAVIGKKSIKSVLNQIIPEPQSKDQIYLLFEGHWIPQGKLEIAIPSDYILTPTVRKNLRDIARIISLGRLPVLLQGDTSVGKTSLITYIAKASGNYCVRINNHEHTDLQEYIGSYASDSNGKLVFKEGVLVEAMRKGYWIILDELNLAPSDVLEALNRVLDDNRELFIPETQQVVKADPNFMLFATQNPPGLYGGRKMLSRAFRNRFVELHFDEIPRSELETILHKRCYIPPTYSKKMIAVMAELQVRRRGSAAVQGKDGFITLRDLFRWGQRYKLASKDLTQAKFYDWDQHIADEGYLILAGKVRQADERNIIEDVLEKHMKRRVNPYNLFSLHEVTSPVSKSILEELLNNNLKEFTNVVWTYNMRRLAVLVAKAFIFDEPVLLVGETGCGKTTMCQVIAALKDTKLLSLNCHMHTESSDFLGGLRPVRQYNNDGRLFEWVDGPLINAMEKGYMFLADEISLADDSVLERMNSLLEPERQLLLAERGLEENSDIVVVTADKKFKFIGTMNPGGDFGKKELSPALRNRFTEIWCDSVSTREDLLKVLERSVSKGMSLGNQEDGTTGIGNSILDFTDWLKNSEVTNKFPFSIRDLLSWVYFINVTVEKGLLDTPEAYVHGACMTFLDCFGTALTGHIDSHTLTTLRRTAINLLLSQISTIGNEYTESLREMLGENKTNFTAEFDGTKFGIKPFYIEIGKNVVDNMDSFTFTAPTTGSNTLRLLRGLQLSKAILLEGNPGVGKTSLVTALAKSSGHKVVRINLSDQTDITDLFGTDLPTEDGSFSFKEGAFLSALQNGDWILLDELNLAPQPVLEGLNACLDHRGEVFIPELGKTFKVKKETRIFACQNPLKQGGARRGLPVSFLNRFTQVYIDTLTKDDLMHIVENQYPSLPKDILQRIVTFNCKVSHEVTEIQAWAHRGSPWELNLRDIQRWCEALVKDQSKEKKICPGKFVDMLYTNRMRTVEDKERMARNYDDIFGPEYPRSDSSPQFYITDKEIVVGDVVLERNIEKVYKNRRSMDSSLLVLRNQLPVVKSLAEAVKMNWLAILVGPTATGKSSIVQMLADLTGNELHVVPVTSTVDVSDLLGGFEQVDYNRNLENLFDKIETLTLQTVRNIWLTKPSKHWKTNKLLNHLHQFKSLQTVTFTSDVNTEMVDKFQSKINLLLKQCETLLQHADISQEINMQLKSITTSLKHLQSKVEKASSLNIGGKFEWIDSLLVKTMIEGSWLLLDNVNLTSAAVLDRLNGLLEPNGVLSIPERGEMSEIKPHPSFRVFFTMDPKYGEISRAMRNRGVEIFIVRSEDWNASLSDTVTYLDLMALLSSTGLPEAYHEICIRCHELMSSFVQGMDHPTVANLIQATHLINQQIVRGISYRTAMINSFSDVYVKPRCGGDFCSNTNVSLSEMKNEMLKTLQEEINNTSISSYQCLKSSHTLAVKELSRNSTYEIVKQISYIATQPFIGIESEKSLDYLISIFVAFQKCPEEVLNVFSTLLNSQLHQTSNSNKELVLELNKKAQEFFVRYKNKSDSYKRFFPEYFDVDEKFIQQSNKITFLLYNEMFKLFIDKLLPTSNFSALDYSRAVQNGTLTDDFSEYPILRFCGQYLKMIDEEIVNSIMAINELNEENACRLFQMFNWRVRFLKMCTIPIFVMTKNKRTPILKEEVIPLLHMHSKWLQKNLMEEIFKLLPQSAGLVDKFRKTLKEILPEIEESTEVAHIGKKLRKVMVQPKVCESENQYQLCLRRSNVYKNMTIDLSQPLERQTHKLLLDASTIIQSIVQSDSSTEVEKLTLFEEILSKSLENVPEIGSNFEIKLIPVVLYVLQRMYNLIESRMPDVLNRTFNREQHGCSIFRTLVHQAQATKGFPPALLCALSMIESLQCRMKLLDGRDHPDLQRNYSLLMSFWDEHYKSLTNSPALYPLRFFAIDQPVEHEEMAEEVPINNKRLSHNGPLMAYYVQRLTVVEDQSARHVLAYKTVSLQNSSDYAGQLITLQNIIWKNIAALNITSALKTDSNANFEIKKFNELILHLNSIVQTVSTDNVGKNAQILAVTEKIKDSNLNEMLLKAGEISQDLLKTKDIDLKTRIYTAELALLTSVIFIKIMAEISPVDHIEKYKLKIQYIEEDIEIFDTLLSTYYMHGVVSGTIPEYRKIEKIKDVTSELIKERSTDLKKVHPYCGVILKLKEQTAAKIEKYASGNTFRPSEPTYNSFAKDCKHFTKSVLSTKTLVDICSSMIHICNSLHQNLEINTHDTKTTQKARDVIKETSSWLYSIKAFYKKIENTYAEAFPDLAKPLQTSMSQIVHSVTTLNDLIKVLISKIEQGPHLKNIVKDLIVYPNNVYKDKHNQMHRFVTPEILGIINRNLLKEDEDSFSADLEKLEVLKMNLQELQMQCSALEGIDHESFWVMESTLSAIVKAWEDQQKDIENKKIDDEALYVTKSKCEDIDEDVQALGEISEMFPSYSEQDFSEFKPPSLEQKVIKTQNAEKTRQLINPEDVSLVFKWHSNFVKNLTSAEWLARPNKKQEIDVLSPFLERYPIFSRIMQHAWGALDSDFEGIASPSLLVIISKIKEKVEGEESSSKFDFYRSPCIAETRQCLPVLHRVKESTLALLDQWPDFPTLKDIMVILNRVLSFPVTSPVSRFLTGLELLRDKIEEWNKNAHKNNNLIDVSLALGQQIINWRKLEMGHWKECLNSVYQRKQAAAHKFWFYLYSVVHMYLEENREVTNDTSPADRLISVLGKFMETSSLAEYEVRLDLMYAYHCHLINMGPSRERDELLSILWNSYNYYAQFAPQVAASIKEKRAPIEKKLRDFVKICTWDRDLSYWSVKDTVEKAHKVLHKHTKEFEKVLDESVISCLVDNSTEAAVEHVALWDRPKRANTNSPVGGAYLVDVHNYIVHASNVKKYLDQIDEPCDGIPEGSLLLKVPSLLNKAKTLCKDTMTNTSYPSLVQSLDDFVTTVIENSNHLRSLEVDSTLPKDKQKAQAKNIIQQKRKALSDLFRYLTKMGLSYRIGLVILAASENLYDFTIHPVDLDVAIKYLKSRRCDSSLSLLWSGCEKYFQKNIVRHRQLAAAMQSPHEDLGMQNIERCKGFAAHLLKITNSQKKSISKYSRRLCELRGLTTYLTNALEVDTTTNVTNLDEKLNVINRCLADSSIILEQFRVVLKSFPEQELRLASEPHFDCVLSNSPLVMCYQNNDEWNDLYSRIRNISTTVNKQKTSVNKLRQTLPKVIGDNQKIPVLSQTQIDGINEAITVLKNVRTDLNKILKDYQYTTNLHPEFSVECSHPILSSLENLEKHINESLGQLHKLDEEEYKTEDTAESKRFITKCEELMASMLLIIQSIYKKHLPAENKSESMDVIDKIDEIIDENRDDEPKEIIEDNHLKELLQEKLFSDAKMLQMQNVTNQLYGLSEDYMFYIGTGNHVEKVKNVVTRLVPILEQTVLFVQYFISQQVAAHRVSCKMLSVLLKIFTDLASKGFCKPSDLDADEAEGEGGPGKLTGGTGLGDGEGQTDVSERIENQDQLEDAHRPGEEKKEEERDCKEEEKAINMSDDFDSHLQDVEPKEGEDSEEDGDNDDADKQMGDIENPAEKLDQKIWGSEDESELEENNESKEEKGKGESTGEKEMGAKEEEQGNDDGNEGKDRKQKKDVNQIDDQDVDDDHNDPYYGNEQQYPEPEDFEMPDNPDMDGDEKDDKDGETETENPFDIDVMKEDQKEDQEEDKQAEENRNGLDVSSDEEGGDDALDDKESEQQKENEKCDAEQKDDDDPTDHEKEKEGPEDSKDDDLEDTDKPPETDPNAAQPENEQDQKDELPKNSDKIEDEEETEQNNQETNPQANPSSDDPSAEDKVENAEMDSGANDNVETNAEQAKDEETAPFEQAQEQVGDEKQSTGRSELDKSDKGHRGEKQAVSRSDSKREQKQRENKPGRTDQERTLGDVNEKKHKQTLTLNVEKEQSQEEGGDSDENADKDADAFQHVKETKKDDLQAIDAATKEQADQQPTIQDEDEDAEKPKQDEEIPMDIDEDELEVEKSEELKPEKIKDGREKEMDKSGNKKEGAEETTGDTGIEIEGDNVVTENVPRGLDTTFHMRLEPMQQETEEMSVEQYMSIREWLLSGSSHNVPTTPVWRALWADSAAAARALCERLRLVLEPTGRSRRAGDFRTGRAINMRRVIPYIASQFRKDRIWLRRTKPAKREYKIAIAVDDSSSMSDNRSKEMAFESLALVSQALNLLESGDLSVLSFGEEPKLLHPFTEQFSEHSGSKILEQLRFDQSKTKIAQLLDFCSVMFEDQAIRSDAVNAKLLVIVSDGRGIFSEGETRVTQAVRRARQQGIFLVYVIIDNPDNKDSIMDIRRPLMDSTTNLVSFVPYLDTFPFPFYVILRDMSALPNVLGDALRQWFELATNTS